MLRKKTYMTVHLFINMQSRLAGLKVCVLWGFSIRRSLYQHLVVEVLHRCKAHANACHYLPALYKALLCSMSICSRAAISLDPRLSQSWTQDPTRPVNHSV